MPSATRTHLPVEGAAPPVPGAASRVELSLAGVLRLFSRQPSVRFLLVEWSLLAAVRLSLPAPSVYELLLPLPVVVAWSFQEWVLHKYVLHLRPFTVLGVKIDPDFAQKHREHHRRPDDLGFIGLPFRVLTVTSLLNFGLWWLISPGAGFAVSGMLCAVSMALIYEWTHFLAHAPYRPKTRYYRNVTRAHRLHHFKNEHFWYGFTLPVVDKMLGTSPDPQQVQTSSTCRTLGVDPRSDPSLSR